MKFLLIAIFLLIETVVFATKDIYYYKRIGNVKIRVITLSTSLNNIEEAIRIAKLCNKYLKSMKQGVNNRYHGHVFSHEIGHTGGLSHPFEMGIQDTYTNGGIVNNKYQSIMLDATSDNFMNYPVKAYEALAHKNFYNAEEMNQILYKFTTKPSPATPTQKLQIRDNYLKGVLNFNDIPK